MSNAEKGSCARFALLLIISLASLRWTIWPTTIRRKQSQALNSPTGILAEGDLDIPEFALQYIKAKHHQFYGPWRSVTLNDGLDKWLGYGGDSQKVTDEGEAIT